MLPVIKRTCNLLLKNNLNCAFNNRFDALTLAKIIQNDTNLQIYNLKRYCTNTSRSCWKCGAVSSSTDKLFCEKCKVIQKPHQHKNLFEVFNLNDSFNIDQKALTNKYRQMQNLLHPDKFSNSTQDEKEISETYSSLVNKAYNTLQIPLKRALHLLSLRNESIEEKNEITDKEFLMEIMELNEEIEEANTPEQLKALNQKNKEILNGLIEEIGKHFNNSKINDAKQSIIKMKYYDSINTRINNILREKGIID